MSKGKKRSSSESNTSKTQPKRRRRTREERGLPSDEALRELATTYLEVQRKLWPKLPCLLSKHGSDQPLISEMGADFRRRFLGDEPLTLNLDDIDVALLAASYSRYSDDNSNPRSLAQQLKLELEKAHQLGYFIPWSLVFADAAVSGTTAKRRGYELAKGALTDVRLQVKALFIDELGRASRDAIESLMLGQLLGDRQKRMVGASDGFDSESHVSKIQLSIFAMLHEWFIDQLRSKVNRGMDDAFDRGHNTGLPAPGYMLIPLVDQNGSPVFGRDGQQVRALAIDEAEAKVILRVFRLYAEKRRSPEKIARLLNRIEFHDLRTWDGSRVRTLLRRTVYVGIQTYRMTRSVRDRVTGTLKFIKRPRKEWRVRRARHLNCPLSTLEKDEADAGFGKRGLDEKRGPGKSRTDVYPSVLIRPICGHCGYTMGLGRSGKYAAFTCLNGQHGKHGCTAKSFKMVGIVERSVLSAVREQVLTSDVIASILDKANVFLQEQSKKPAVNTTNLKAKLKDANQKRDRLYRLAERGRELKGVAERIEKYERRIEKLRAQVRRDEQRNAPVPPALTRDQVEHALQDLQGLLTQDIGTAAPILAQLTGPVRILQERETGKPRPTWTAHFDVNLVPVIAKLTAGKNCPTSGTWEFLNARGWTNLISIAAKVVNPPYYERVSEDVLKMHKSGVSVVIIAAKLKKDRGQVQQALTFALTGQRPKWKAKTKKGGQPRASKFEEIAPDVMRLRDIEKMSFAKIAKELGFNQSTIRRAYDYGHPEMVDRAVKMGSSAHRGRVSDLGEEKYKTMRKMLRAKTQYNKIAKAIGCSMQAVYLEAKRLKQRKQAS